LQDFVLAVHHRAAAAGPGGLTKRAEIMLELVVDIKNNRARDVKASRAAAAAAASGGSKGKAAAGQNVGGGRGGAAAVVQPGLLKWLKASGVDDVTLANISWAKLVQPNKKGEWSQTQKVCCYQEKWFNGKGLL
jgi:nucleolar MIF4G domain-containing protein 1